MEYQIAKGKIICADGIPYLPRWFCDDRIAYEIDAHGISKVEYFNRTTRGSEKVFVDDMWGGLRFYLEKDGFHYGWHLTNCEIMPFGVTAEWTLDQSKLKIQCRACGDCIVVMIEPMQLADELTFCSEFYDNWRMLPRHDGDTRYVSGIERTWNAWRSAEHGLTCSYRENSAETGISIASDLNTTYIHRTIGFSKHILQSEVLQTDKTYHFVMALDTSEKAAENRAQTALRCIGQWIAAQEQRYAAVQEKMPVLESPYPELNNFFALAPLYHESCKVQSEPGAIRAKTEHYWVWGWDGMSSSFAYAYWDDVDFMAKMLKLYQQSADPEKGIGHWFARDMSHIETSPIPAQGFYISLLYQFYLNSGDITPYYDFAKRIFHLICSTEAGNTGLFEGYSLVPDFRKTILENGNDLSTFNNSSAYCAVRAMGCLAAAVGDSETKTAAEALADRTRGSFNKILFDEAKGTYAASADAATLEQRPVYMSPAIKWDNRFCMDLIGERTSKLLQFYEKNYVSKAGLMFAPTWGVGFDADANQMHCYWPSNGECYTRLTNLENRRDLIEQWIGWISCWTKILMCPEGIDCYDNVNRPKPDGWNAVNGTWQGYSMRAWYEAVIHSVVGIDFSENGLGIYPYDGEAMKLLNLHFAGRTFDVHMNGSGCRIANVIVNGTALGAVTVVPFERFENTNTVEIWRQ